MLVLFIGPVMGSLFVELADEITELPQGFFKIGDLDAILADFLFMTEFGGKGYLPIFNFERSLRR
jgi:hypothetical protein